MDFDKSPHEFNCGHTEPSNVGNAYTARPVYAFDKSYSVILNNIDDARIEVNSKQIVSI